MYARIHSADSPSRIEGARAALYVVEAYKSMYTLKLENNVHVLYLTRARGRKHMTLCAGIVDRVNKVSVVIGDKRVPIDSVIAIVDHRDYSAGDE